MAVFLLLLIVAILLFGSSIVIGVIGRILGTVIAVGSAVWAITAMNLSTEGVALMVLALAALIGLANYVLPQMQKSSETPARPSPLAASSSAAYRKHGAEIEANRKFRDRYLSDN